MFFHHTDDRMIPYLGSEFVRALLGLDVCDGAAEAPLDLDSGEPLVMPAKIKAQSDDCRYTALKTIPNGDKPSSLPESKREIGRLAAEKATLSESVDPDINACCILDSDSLGITCGDLTNPETLTTPHRARFVVFSLWNRLVHWLNKHTGAREC